MFPLTALCLIWGFTPAPLIGHPSGVPRETVPYHNENVKLFREEGIWNYSSMLLMENSGILLVGAREAIFALDMNDISHKKAATYWRVTDVERNDCTSKGKREVDCKNYIRTLHKVEGSRVYVCGTKAFNPTCVYMTYAEEQLTLEGKEMDGKGKCPFDPLQRYASLMVGEDLYSATSMNFLGFQPVLQRSSVSALRTEFESAWFNEPRFTYMETIPESDNSPEGDDDKIYLFFSETAIEYDFYKTLMVSRVARVCKGDLGGQRILQKKWTTFLKAHLDCPVLDSRLPYIVDDVFLWRDSDWRKSIFYAVFNPQSAATDQSVVCAYSVSAIGEVFSEGKYKTPITVENTQTKWVMYSGEVPTPRPGACINNAAKQLGMKSSQDLPDKTLQFIRTHPLMDQTIQPLGEGPLLVKRGPKFTRIVVDSVVALDGHGYQVMFIGTENGFVQKAVNYDGEIFIIEEVQLFAAKVPIEILRFSLTTGHLYAGSSVGAVQIPLRNCSRYITCLDCVLARDPYCAWNLTDGQCTALTSSRSASRRNLIQSLKDGNATICPNSASVKPENLTVILGNNIELPCPPGSNLAQTRWYFAHQPLYPSDQKQVHSKGLLILRASAADAGVYTCLSVEQGGGTEYSRTLAAYQLIPSSDVLEEEKLLPATEAQRMRGILVALQVSLVLLAFLFVALLVWNLFQGHLPLLGRRRISSAATTAEQKDALPNQLPLEATRDPENKPLMPGATCRPNNNCSSETSDSRLEYSQVHDVNPSPFLNIKNINDESEI